MEKYVDNNLFSILKSNGKSKSIDDFNICEEYIKRFNETPSVLKIVNDDIDFFNVIIIREELIKIFPKIKLLFKDSSYYLKNKRNISKREIWLIDDGYIMDLSIDRAYSFFNDPKNDLGVDKFFELCDYNIVAIPNNTSKFYNEEINKKLYQIFDKSIIKENKRSSIGMVAIDNGELYVKDFSFRKNIILRNMDLHYGDGFTIFDKKLIKKLKKDKKGLVLFHGLPGTGKCVRKNTNITVRNKITGEIENINISDLM